MLKIKLIRTKKTKTKKHKYIPKQVKLTKIDNK